MSTYTSTQSKIQLRIEATRNHITSVMKTRMRNDTHISNDHLMLLAEMSMRFSIDVREKKMQIKTNERTKNVSIEIY